MSAPRTPAWVPLLIALHAATLYLYPRDLRALHGEDMRQAFRDRCREAVAGNRGPFGLLLRELLPDTLRAVPEAHLSRPAFSSNPRQLLALGLLCLSLIGLLARDSLSGWVLDHGFAIRNHWQAYRYQRELDRLEGATRVQAAALAESADPAKQALAANLYATLAPERVATVALIDEGYPDPGWGGVVEGSAADAEHARRLAMGVQSASPSVLSAAALACTPEVADCDRRALVAKLIAVDGENAFAHELAFSEAARRGDTLAQAAALQAMANASRYDTYRSEMAAQLFAAAAQLDGDPSHLAAVAWAQRRAGHETLQDWYGSVRFACTPRRDHPGSRSHWVDLHPEAGKDCERIAALLAHSGDFKAAMWGLRRAMLGGPGDEVRSRARREWRALAWLQFHGGGTPAENDENWNWTPWTEAEWARWATSYSADGGEIPAMRRWLIARSKPAQAPDWFMPSLR